jgi:SHS2 domain-containing protein
MRFKFLDDLTSDVMFEAYGGTLEEVFINSAYALFSIVCDVEKVEPRRWVEVEIGKPSTEELLYEWLNYLLYESEVRGMFFSKFEIKIKKGKNLKLKGKIGGEEVSQEKGGTVVKGITYYGFALQKTKNGYKAKIAVDI